MFWENGTEEETNEISDGFSNLKIKDQTDTLKLKGRPLQKQWAWK